MNLEIFSAKQLGDLVNTKEISVKEVLDYFHNRIDKLNPRINAITYTKWDEAYIEGDRIQNKILSGEYVGPFAGVPIALKDFLPSKKGWINTHGGVKSLKSIDKYDSEFYKACNKLGAIAIGKTNAPPFGFSGLCQNKLYGQTNNPFNLEYNSGGSSGGSAAAVASGMVMIGEGGDAGGSIRIPASWCNLFGFKPSLGTVPNVARPDAWSATHPYCAGMGITKTVEDAAILLTEMAKYDPRDPMSLPINANIDYNKLNPIDIKNTRIGLTYDFGLYKIDPKIKDAIDVFARRLEDMGAYVEPVEFKFIHSIEQIIECWSWSISIDTYLDIDNWLKEGFDLLGSHESELYKEFIHFQKEAFKFDIFKFREFNEIRTEILDNFENVFDNYDFIVSPVTSCTPLKLSNEGDIINKNYLLSDQLLNHISFSECLLVNFIGYPACSIPIMLLDNNLPIGAQIIGKQYADKSIFRLSKFYESIYPWIGQFNYVNL